MLSGDFQAAQGSLGWNAMTVQTVSATVSPYQQVGDYPTGTAMGNLDGTIPEPIFGAMYFYSSDSAGPWFTPLIKSGDLFPTTAIGAFHFLASL